MTQSTAAASHRDNLIGICHATGEATGIDPLVLRLALALCFLLSAPLALALYGACGAALCVDRLASWMGRPFRRGGRAAAA